jgi:hypothetical protein
MPDPQVNESTDIPKQVNPFLPDPTGGDSSLSFNREQADIRTSRLKREELQQKHDLDDRIFKRNRDAFILGFLCLAGTSLIIFAIILCVGVIKDNTASQESKSNAYAVISSIISSTLTGIVTYIATPKP